MRALSVWALFGHLGQVHCPLAQVQPGPAGSQPLRASSEMDQYVERSMRREAYAQVVEQVHSDGAMMLLDEFEDIWVWVR